jgi:hypothetical protein
MPVIFHVFSDFPGDIAFIDAGKFLLNGAGCRVQGAGCK